MSYDLFDGKIVPLVGVRTYHDKRTFEDSTSSLPSKKDVNTWRVNLSWLPTDDLTMFVTAATGFRQASSSRRCRSSPCSSPAFRRASRWIRRHRRTTKSASSGARRTARLSVGLNLYKTKYEDLQTNTPGRHQRRQRLLELRRRDVEGHRLRDPAGVRRSRD